ncbi:hypothetical protein ACFYW6_18050 [Streptomyces sp. NPDC002659]|uniref:hypothetical protein n=1 Tax=Streptomyces sp. NPDC002659 TaxID=3364656 RepID=UPI0036CFC4ED
MTRLIVEGRHEFTELRVLDPLMRELDTGTHMLVMQLPPGIYLVEAKVPGAVDERLVCVPDFGELRIGDLTPEIDSPAPLPGVRTYHQSHEDAALKESGRVHITSTEGNSGHLFIFVRSDGSPRERPPQLSVRTPGRTGRPVAMLEQGVANPDAGYCALSLAVSPGTYMLAHEAPGLGWRGQAVFVEEGWQTQVFIPWDTQGVGVERALVTMLPGMGFKPARGWMYDHVEAALDGLARGRLVLTDDDEYILRHTNDFYENPILSLISGYGLLTERRFPRWSVDAITERFLHVVPHNPDAHLLHHLFLQASSQESVHLTDSSVRATFDTPPMFAVGAAALLKMAADDADVVPADSWMSELAPVLTGGSVYTRWRLAG